MDVHRNFKTNSMTAWRTPPPSTNWLERNAAIFTFTEMMKEQ